MLIQLSGFKGGLKTTMQACGAESYLIIVESHTAVYSTDHRWRTALSRHHNASKRRILPGNKWPSIHRGTAVVPVAFRRRADGAQGAAAVLFLLRGL
jgi:hypothetical protein